VTAIEVYVAADPTVIPRSACRQRMSEASTTRLVPWNHHGYIYNAVVAHSVTVS